MYEQTETGINFKFIMFIINLKGFSKLLFILVTTVNQSTVSMVSVHVLPWLQLTVRGTCSPVVLCMRFLSVPQLGQDYTDLLTTVGTDQYLYL